MDRFGVLEFRGQEISVDRLSAELNAALATTEMRGKMFALGVRVTPGPPEAARDEIKRDYDRFGPLIKSAGIKVK
jgi:tripartite-type tricarboxylate transporter receptor subunit TctC